MYYSSICALSENKKKMLKKNNKKKKNKDNDNQFQKLLIVNQILLFRTRGNVKRTLWRI